MQRLIELKYTIQLDIPSELRDNKNVHYFKYNNSCQTIKTVVLRGKAVVQNELPRDFTSIPRVPIL